MSTSTPKPFDPALLQRVIGPYLEGQPSVEERGEIYQELLGFVPPRIRSRFHVTGALDTKMLDLQEQARTHAMYPEGMDQKTVQLLLFGMLLMDMSDAATVHGLAARRAGASWAELQAVISLCYLFRGLPAANRGADILADLAAREDAAATAASKAS
ncbi:carboxymuconolactone decarboxylase family protein [Ottowia thiooxydans]|uniref:carboxymuconolactone decarboxylase family protein n=1 Tax=Ottowia thiooxydans TaxID=219182 RepID=UPI0003FF6ACC|nr:carboxymuconolactone decarboxylase family protein [Ottowia thiooxydans]